jgi:hypothetical protein
LFEVGVIVVSLFNLASRFLERRRKLAALRREDQQHSTAVDYHVLRDELNGSQQGPHYWRGRGELARLRRNCDEQRMLQTGKSFWELEDIDSWAIRMRNLERSGSTELCYMLERLPTSAIMPLQRRLTELRRAEERARDEDCLADLPGLRAGLSFAPHLRCGE